MKRDDLIEGVFLFLCGGGTVALFPADAHRYIPDGGFRAVPSVPGDCADAPGPSLSWGYPAAKGSERAFRGGRGCAPRGRRADAAVLGASALAVLCLNILGYPLTSFLLMLLLLWILGLRRPVLLVTLPLLAAAGSYLLFVQFLKIPLPKGLIGL